jgi:DNA repair protein RadD
MELRYYQREALDAAYADIRTNKQGTLIVLPTGSGKSAVIATAAKEAVQKWGARVLIISHVRELIEQVSETILKVLGTWDAKSLVGIYSAGLKSRDTSEPIICASIQSIYNKAPALGRFDLILIDEAHLVPPDGEGMYQRFLADSRVINPELRVVGLTATDFRLGSGYIHGEGRMFSTLCYEAKVRDLIDQKFLCDLRGKDGGAPDLTNVRIKGGEYESQSLSTALAEVDVVASACREVEKYGQGRNAGIVFCCSVEHANMVTAELKKNGHGAETIVGDTPSQERSDLIAAFKERRLRFLVSVGVLTTGFDAPHVDLIVLMRPTLSPSLYVQMVGRGLRVSPYKKDCLVLDLAGVIAEHGPIDDIRIKEKKKGGDGGAPPTKTCPQCAEILPASAIVCHCCGHEMPREIARHDAVAANVSPLKNLREEIEKVKRVKWMVHVKKGGDANTPKTLRVIYEYGIHQDVSEWVCLEHSGFARRKAEDWWRVHCGKGEAPTSATDALDWMDKNDERLIWPGHIKVRFGERFPELIEKQFEIKTTQEDMDYETFKQERAEIPIKAGVGIADDEPPF